MNGSNDRLPSYALVSPEEAQRFAEVTKSGRYDLTEAEMSWRDRYSNLAEFGYMLRSRYRPGWTPSWLGTNLNPRFCEDSIMLSSYNIIYATRRRDCCLVAVKLVPNNTDEISIARYLTAPNLKDIPTNHCVPILDILPDPLDKNRSLLIMPYLRPFNDPEFCTIGEVVDFVRQTLEGLCFLHNQGVAHRDCAGANIMMDARPLYPLGHHPVRRNYSPDAIYDVSPLSRIDHPVTYFFIDFDLSRHFLQGSSSLVLGKEGRDKDVPELSYNRPYNAFKVDIFSLGNVYYKESQKYHGLEFLEPLVDVMKEVEPGQRPTAVHALQIFEAVRSQLNSSQLRWRLRSRSESTSERVVYDTVAVAREGIYHLKRLIT